MTPLAKLLEAALFASAVPVPVDALRVMAAHADDGESTLDSALAELRDHYDNEGHGVELIEVAGGWQILTRPEYTEAIERAQLAARPQRLSAAALETLAIIAYRQPATKAVIESIRGVDCEAVLEHLTERGLIEEIARQDSPGHPRLFGTTLRFLQLVGLERIEDLPPVSESAALPILE